jgi:uncharacterized protein YbcI
MDVSPEAPERGQLLTEVTNRIVALHRRHFGRGPGAAKTVMVDDLVVCTLSDIYTPAEQTLIRAGKEDRVRETRHLHQITLAEEIKAEVTAATSRPVVAFISSVHFDPDLAVEIFYLGPPGASL